MNNALKWRPRYARVLESGLSVTSLGDKGLWRLSYHLNYRKLAHQHVQNTTFGLFTACWPSGFISTCFNSSKVVPNLLPTYFHIQISYCNTLFSLARVLNEWNKVKLEQITKWFEACLICLRTSHIMSSASKTVSTIQLLQMSSNWKLVAGKTSLC